MNRWRSQHFKKYAKKLGSDQKIIDNAVKIGANIQSISPNAEPIFSLKHLSHATDIDYRMLREIVERKVPERYRTFRIKKRSNKGVSKDRYRIICVPDPGLMALQRWINDNILAAGKVHESSVAFRAKSNIVDAAKLHCGCGWLIKLDIVNFFESITEQMVYQVFASMGYQPLVAFELARVCTRKGQKSPARNRLFKRWRTRYYHYSGIPSYASSDILGHLPQGAPTSPLLANLVMHEFDREMYDVAETYGLTFTRYADDLTFSRHEGGFSRKMAENAVSAFYQIIRRYNFSPNYTKTNIVPPGARKMVLGLLVDGQEPRLSKEFRNKLRMHLHHIGPNGRGVVKHAEENCFKSIYGLKNHIGGLISYANQVDNQFAKSAWDKFNRVSWP